MNRTLTINKKEIAVTFSDYFDSELGDFLFRQVMCDVYMPGNEVDPIAVEKEQMKLVVEGFKKRKVLYEEIKKEDVKGKSFYVISPRMRYDLDWMAEKPKLPSSKDPKADLHAPIPAAVVEVDSPAPKAERPAETRVFTDAKRKYLIAEGFRFNPETSNWEIHDIRFPDSKIDKSGTESEFASDITRLVNASRLRLSKRKAKKK